MKKAKAKLVYVFSFIIPCFLLSIIWWKCGIYPFGEKSNMVNDLGIQYVELYSYIRNAFLGKAGLGYSFKKSLGGSLVGIIAYYLASPINILLMLFKQDDLQMFVYIASIIKMGLCGCFQAVYLKNRFTKLKDFEIVFLSICFAVSYYNITQVQNLMWMDGVFLLPLILYGAWRFQEKKGEGILIITVFASIVFNWYTAYMNCLFAIIYYIYEMLGRSDFKFKQFFNESIHFGLCMLWGILLSSVLFLPNIYSLLQGKGEIGKNIFEFQVNGNLINIIRGFVAGNDRGSNSLSLFCGSGIFLFATVGIVYLYKEKKRDFCVSSLFLGLLALSLLLKPLENVWNGFRYAYSYMYRFSYLQTWSLIYFAAIGILNYKKMNYIVFKVSLVYILIFIVLDYIFPFEQRLLYFTFFVLMVLSFGWYYLKNSSLLIARLSCMGILGITIFELFVNGVVTCNESYTWWKSKDYIDYVYSQRQLIDLVKFLDRGKFYRVEQTLNRGFERNKNSAFFLENMGYNYCGISHYTSAFNEKVRRLISSLGYGENDTVTMYDEPILASDSFLGIKYILADMQYPQLQLKSDYEFNNKKIYENPFALPLGFAVSDECIDSINLENHFEVQNDVYSKLLGREVQLFKPVRYQMISHGNNEIAYEMNLQEGSILYGYANSDIGDLSLFIDGQYRCRYQGWLSYRVFNISDVPGIHEVKFENYTGNEEQIHPYFYQFDLDSFREVIESLKRHEFKVATFEDGLVKGEFEAVEDGWMLLTIPMEKGWKVTVNGKDVQAKTGINALMLIPVQCGENNIVLQYHVPYLRLGLAISILSTIVFVFYMYRRRKCYL